MLRATRSAQTTIAKRRFFTVPNPGNDVKKWQEYFQRHGNPAGEHSTFINKDSDGLFVGGIFAASTLAFIFGMYNLNRLQNVSGKKSS